MIRRYQKGMISFRLRTLMMTSSSAECKEVKYKLCTYAIGSADSPEEARQRKYH